MTKLYDDAVRHYAAAFDTIKNTADPLWSVRKEAIDGFVAGGFPTRKNEQWRFTDLSPLLTGEFLPVPPREPNSATRELVDKNLFSAWQGPQLVFVDGYFRQEFSHIPKLPAGMMLQTIAANGIASNLNVLQATHPAEDAFVKLNKAFIQDGVLLKVAANTVYEHPVHILSVQSASSDTLLRTTSNLIQLEANSSLDVVETVCGVDGGTYFNNSALTVRLEENAAMNYYRVQQESSAAFHVSNLLVDQQRSSRFKAHHIDFGGRLVRNNIMVQLNGEGAETTLNGLYSAEGSQHIDNHTVIEHRAANCQSHEQYQGILGGASHGVFSGMIHVFPDAQKTDAKQSNNCLLLSDVARIDSKPQLEIYADDVKCTHGATVGQLNDEELFYLRSRGIGLSMARRMLTYAFAEKIIEHIELPVFNERVENLFVEKFNRQMEQTGK